jgi:hypothetical protein
MQLFSQAVLLGGGGILPPYPHCNANALGFGCSRQRLIEREVATT